MTLGETLKDFRDQEKQSGQLLLAAVCRNKSQNQHMLISADSLYLPAVNTKARIKWGTSLIRELFQFFKIPKAESDPEIPVFLLTLADKSLVTTDLPQHIDIELFKRKLGARLRGFNYIGMIEPGYYYNTFDEKSEKTGLHPVWLTPA